MLEKGSLGSELFLILYFFNLTKQQMSGKSVIMREREFLMRKGECE